MLLNLQEILKVADEQKFAIPAFNIGTGQMLNGTLEKCEELNAPVILEIHPFELEFQGDSFMKMCLDRAEKSSVPVCVHLDHGDWEYVLRAIRTGFTSVMIDASSESFEDNVAITKKVCDIAHSLGISVEAELGTIGSTNRDTSTGNEEVIYTNVNDAARFVEETGCDALAVAIGTSHGLYPADMQPELKIDLLKDIKKNVDTPLVLHGGSGNRDEEIQEAVKCGISKINISSDTKDAMYKQIRKTLEDQYLREPFEIYIDAIRAMQKVVEEKLILFNTVSQAAKY